MNKSAKLTAVFGLCALIGLTGCVDQGVNPYDVQGTTNDAIVQVDSVKTKFNTAGNYAQNLEDGIYVVQLKDEGTNLIVVKDSLTPSMSYKGHGYLGIDNISDDYVPSDAPDIDNGLVSVWNVAKGDFVQDLQPGIHNMTIDGDALNGQDLSLTVMKDSVTPSMSYKGQGYLGIAVK